LDARGRLAKIGLTPDNLAHSQREACPLSAQVRRNWEDKMRILKLALASAVAQGFVDAAALGAIDRVPRLHAVQTAGGSPLARAYGLVASWIAERVGEGGRSRSAPELAEMTARGASRALIDDALAFARTHRSRFMWPWETEPSCVAHGILDDETYDWAAVVEAMLKTGGWPIVVDEEDLRQANDLSRELTRIDADHTGTAGLAGLLCARRAGVIDGRDRVAVLFTGVRRGADRRGL
jgi:threonine synthase